MGGESSPGTSVPQGALTATFSVLMHILAPFLHHVPQAPRRLTWSVVHPLLRAAVKPNRPFLPFLYTRYILPREPLLLLALLLALFPDGSYSSPQVVCQVKPAPYQPHTNPREPLDEIVGTAACNQTTVTTA